MSGSSASMNARGSRNMRNTSSKDFSSGTSSAFASSASSAAAAAAAAATAAAASVSSSSSSSSSLTSSQPLVRAKMQAKLPDVNVEIAESFEHQFKWFEAIFYWQKACETDEDPTGSAEWRMGNRYWWAFGVAEDEEKAKILWQKSASKGHKGGRARCYLLGLGSFLKDEQKAFQFYCELVNETNDVDGQCTVGWCYETGKGVQKNEKRAAKWYHRAAEEGHANAYGCLGWCFESGIGVKKDEKSAVECYQQAANQGHARAQCNLAACYEAGIGVDKNEKIAIEWYTRAAKQGDEQAKSNLEVLARTMTAAASAAPAAIESAANNNILRMQMQISTLSPVKDDTLMILEESH